MPGLNVTPEMARAELARRQSLTPDLARQELQRRQQAQSQEQARAGGSALDPYFLPDPEIMMDNPLGFLTAPPGNLIKDLAIGASNLPGQISRGASAVADFASSPLEKGGAMIGAAAEAIPKVAGAVMDDPSVALQIAKSMLPSRERVREDLLGLGLDAGALAVPAGAIKHFSRVADAATDAQTVSRALNPVRVIATGGKKIAEAAGRKVKESLKNRLSASSGLPSGAIDIAERAGREGADVFDAARKRAIKEGSEVVIQEAGIKVGRALEEAQEFKNLEWRRNVKELTLADQGSPIDPNTIRSAFAKTLKDDFNIKTVLKGDGSLEVRFPKSFKHTEVEKARIEAAIQDMWGWDNPSIDSTMEMKEVLVPLLDLGPDRTKFARSNKIIGEAFGAIDKELESKVRGYSKLRDTYKQQAEFIKRVRKGLGLRANDDPLMGIGIFDADAAMAINENLLTKMGTLLNDRGSFNLAQRKSLVRELERTLNAAELRDKGFDVVGKTAEEIDTLARRNGVNQSIFEEVAGALSGDPMTRGIAKAQGTGGTSLAGVAGGAAGYSLGGYAGGVVGAALGSGGQRLLRGMTTANPRAVASFFKGLGMAEKKAAQLQELIEKMRKTKTGRTAAKAPGAGLDVATFGAAMDQTQQSTLDRLAVRKLMGELGVEP